MEWYTEWHKHNIIQYKHTATRYDILVNSRYSICKEMKSKKKKILIAEAATGGIAWEKVFLEIS